MSTLTLDDASVQNSWSNVKLDKFAQDNEHISIRIFYVCKKEKL